MKWQNLNEGAVGHSFSTQTKSNSFDDASVVLEGTSVRDKVNHLCGSQSDPGIFLYAPQKLPLEKNKKRMKTLNTSHCIQELAYARKHSCVP